MTSDRKTEPPLKLDMGFGEALERFARVKPEEVAGSIERSKAKRPPEEIPRGPERTKRGTIQPGRRRKPEGT